MRCLATRSTVVVIAPPSETRLAGEWGPRPVVKSGESLRIFSRSMLDAEMFSQILKDSQPFQSVRTA